jgi:hypothetical protein
MEVYECLLLNVRVEFNEKAFFCSIFYNCFILSCRCGRGSVWATAHANLTFMRGFKVL